MRKSKLITAISFIAAAVLSVVTMSGCVNIHVYPQQPVIRDGEIPVPMAQYNNGPGDINVDPNMCIKPKPGTGAPGDVKTPSGDIEYR